MNITKCTVVTCYFSIPSKNTDTQYWEWISNFLSLNCNMIIFTDTQNYDKIKSLRSESNTRIILYELSDFYVYKYKEYFDYCKSIDDETYHTPELYMIWNEKTFMCKRAIEFNPFNSDYFCWSDIGCIRNKEMLVDVKDFPNDDMIYNLVPSNKFILSSVSYLDYEKMEFKNNIATPFLNFNGRSPPRIVGIQGGFFIGHLNTWSRWIKEYKAELELFATFKNYGGKDQNIMMNLYSKQLKAPFINLINAKNNIKNKYVDEWFYFLYYFSKVSTNYITTKLVGGLGNQLFQIATTIGTSKSHEMIPIFYDLNYNSGDTKRPSYWNNFLRKIPIQNREINFKDYFERSDHSFEPLPNYGENTRLNGYFQSSKYFNSIKNELIQLFILSKSDQHIVDTIVNNIRTKFNKPLVGLHVRRTDYCKLGWDLPMSYYKNAINKFLDVVFVIFSDDIKWCERNFDFLENKILICNTDYIELCILSKCDSYIISNSTFAWWSAYLGDYHNIKTTIAPFPWFINQSYNPEIYESHWIKLSRD
jgi:hypothetical protein